MSNDQNSSLTLISPLKSGWAAADEDDEEDFEGRLLHQASLWDNAELLEDLLNGELLSHINCKDALGRSALHASVTNESPECTRILLQAGADPNTACGGKGENETPLHVAAQHGNLEAMRLLLEWQADLLAKTSNGLTAMDLAEQSNHTECMEVLRQAADERERRRRELYEALREACTSGDLVRSRALLKELGSEAELIINLSPNGSNTLLFKSCEEGKKEIAQLLLDHGSDWRIHPVTKYSPLYIACYYGHKDIVEMLLRKFPHLVQMATVECWLPIHAAVINGHIHVMEILLRFSYPEDVMLTFQDKTKTWEYQLPFDINARDVTGQTVLYLACYVENQRLVDLLLKFRVKATKADSKDDASQTDENEEEGEDTSPTKNNRISNGIQALMSKLNLSKTPSENNLKSNETLLCPIELDTYCSGGSETALHVAVRARNHTITAMLLKAGADPNLKVRRIDEDEGEGALALPTALVEACRRRDHTMIDLLLKHGAQDEDRGALTAAVQHNDDGIISKLLMLKAHPDPEYKINRRAFDLVPAAQFKALGLVGVNTVTPSSMFPSVPVMVNWHGHQCLTHVREQWLVDASLAHNTKLKLNPKNPSLALLSITRLDISNNLLIDLPPCIFQLQSLRYLNVAQNKLEQLPNGCKVMPLSPRQKIPRSSSDSDEVYQCPVLEEVHLQDNRLDFLPPALFQLPALVVLDVSNNKLQSLPFKMWTAPKLRELNASFNLLKDLPVKASSSRHSSFLAAENKSTCSSRDLSDDQLSACSDASPRHSSTYGDTGSDVDSTSHEEGVVRCGGYDDASLDGCGMSSRSSTCLNLQQRDLAHHNLWSHSVEISENFLDSDDEARDNQSQLITLNLAHNAFDTIPVGLPCLGVNIARLNFSYNRLMDMGPVHAYPGGLKQLDLSHNQIRTWPSLRHCDMELSSDGQTPACFGTNDLSIAKLCTKSTLAPVRKLSRATRGSSTSLASLSAVLCIHRRHYRLENLRTLILADNQLPRLVVTLDDEVGSIASDDNESQESLDISGTTPKDLSKSVSPTPTAKPRNLFPNLSMLDLSDNNLREIPPNICELTNLSVLNISGNVDVCHLPPEMGLLSKLWNLNTRGCNLNEPLKTMIESKKYKTMDVVGYLKSILEDAKPYARMKLMIVGVQGIGKTSLLDQLRQEGTGTYKKKPVEHWAKRMGNKNINVKTAKGSNMSTVGVDIGDWTYEKKVRGHSSHGPVTFRTWDFGGQREYYSTHQYFLSKRSLYLVVWKITDGQKGVAEITQWLVNIQARAPNSPVIIVGTHYDLVKEKFPPSYSEDLQQLIRDRFINIVDADKCGLPRVLDTIEVSCKTRHNMKLLCNLIYDTVFELRSPVGSKERLLAQRIPATYLALEDVVSCLSLERRLQSKDPVLQSEQYKMLVMHEMQERFHTAFRDMAELNQATTFLHENGVVLHYEDATLKDLYFLDPQWLCDMLAHVVTIREINPFARNGIMKLDDLKHVFKSSQCAPTDAKAYIVNLLNKFEVALTWDSRTLLIPSLLPTEEQLHSGLPSCDVRIPVRSRGWAMRCKAFQATKASTVVGSPQRHEEPKVTTVTSVSDDCEILYRSNPQRSLRRLLLMSYFPSGFWSRLLTRMLADDAVVEIIRNYLVLPREVQQDPGLLGLLERNRAEWVCWQTGMELRYADTTLFRMKEVLPQPGAYYSAGAWSCPYHKLHFLLQQEGAWATVDLNNTAILEIFLPNQTVVLQRRLSLAQELQSNNSTGSESVSDMDESFYQRIILDPNPECVAKLLALAVDHIDTLLEDWYPTLGTRFVHTSEGRFLVTRLVPCPHCLFANQTRPETTTTTNGYLNSGPFDGDSWVMVGMNGSNEEPCIVKDVSLLRPSREFGRARSQSPGPRHQHPGSRDSTTSLDSDSGVGPDSTSSSRKPSAEGHSDAELTLGQDDAGAMNAALAERHDNIVYSFMVEDCILSAYEEKVISCPIHGELPLMQIAPDAVFLDLGERYLIRPESIKRGKMLGRGAFGFVFKATVKQRASSSYIDVALKMLQPVEPGFGARQSAIVAYKAAQSKWQRDPIQYACKAYCTARQELNILMALRHPNIVPLVGVCTRPLALILELAPQGALDAVLKNYRRSGARLSLDVLQKVILQIAKALEYLHQQHIIYRDLKSENVLVWALPPPFTHIVDALVDVKLADYGISRATLPTGTKGFGGTEGFMAPEIMRYNGEEEYTEKVDCFSFGMFMYELLTLHLPFEGHESVKDHVLDGGRPSLTQRETLYPTYMLDLMVLCWSHQPKDRPSASQIVSIASAPEFVHLLDVISLDDQTAVICAAAADIEQELGNGEWSVAIPQVEVWLSCLGHQLDVLTCNQYNWQDSKTLTSDNAIITQICVVGDKVWLGDSKGIIHIYSVGGQYTELHSFALETDAVVPSAVRCICYMPELQRVAVTLSNGRLWLYSAQVIPNADGSWPDDYEGHIMSELGSNGNPIYCMAGLYVPEKRHCELWCGQTQGTIAIFTQKETIIASQEIINHYDPIMENCEVLQLVASTVPTDLSVWSYIYPGCVVYHWDARSRTILNKLDCSKLVPCSESLKSISIEEHLSPGRCQVTALTAVDSLLYIGTTWGCIVVAESKSMRPTTIFRPLEEEVKAILPAHLQRNHRSPNSQPTTPTNENRWDSSPIIITIGKGYRNLLSRFTSLPISSVPGEGVSSRKSMYAMLWRSDHWYSS